MPLLRCHNALPPGNATTLATEVTKTLSHWDDTLIRAPLAP